MDLFDTVSSLLYCFYSHCLLTIRSIFTDWLWSEWFWLPPGYYWTEVNPTNPYNSEAAKALIAAAAAGGNNSRNNSVHQIVNMTTTTKNLPDALDLFKHSFLLALFFVVFRQMLERYVFGPIGKHVFGIADRQPRRASPNPVLEAHYDASRSNKHPVGVTVTMLARKSGKTEREVESWFRTKRGEKKPAKLTKFRESGGRLCLRTCIIILDFVVLWKKTWLRRSALVFEDYPLAPLDADIRILYIVQFAFYLSLLMTLFHDVRRGDFKEELLHHVVTILLILLSWCLNQVRIGSLVMLDMDPCDVLLEVAKLATYMSYQRVADMVFIVFAVLWVVTRIFLYLYVIMYNSMVMPLFFVKMFPGFIVFNGLLGIIFILQLYWFSLIVKVAAMALRSGKVEDVRSDDDEDTASTGSNESLSIVDGLNGKLGDSSNKLMLNRNGTTDQLITQRKVTAVVGEGNSKNNIADGASYAGNSHLHNGNNNSRQYNHDGL